MKRIIAFVLSLILIGSLIPFTALAAQPVLPSNPEYAGPPKAEEDEMEDLVEKVPEDLLPKKNDNSHPGEDHTLGWAYDTKYHWLECACGCRIGMELHVNPLDTEDDTCTCGYHFSDNADLVVLWIGGAFPIKNFNKNVTEYTIKAHTYKDFEEVKISAFPFDCCSTIEYPEDLTLHEGENVYEIKVIAENQKNIKTYTVTVVKESD